MARSKKTVTASMRKNAISKPKEIPNQVSARKIATPSRAKVKPKVSANPKVEMEKAAKVVAVAAKEDAKNKPKSTLKGVSTPKFSPAPHPKIKKLTTIVEIPMEKKLTTPFYDFCHRHSKCLYFLPKKKMSSMVGSQLRALKSAFRNNPGDFLASM